MKLKNDFPNPYHPMTPEQINSFFENVRKMRIHQIAFDESHYTSIRDKLKAREYQKKVDDFIKRQVALERSKQKEIF